MQAWKTSNPRPITIKGLKHKNPRPIIRRKTIKGLKHKNPRDQKKRGKHCLN
jgi:hypothetical protein